MTAELVRHQPAAPATLPDKMEYARALAASGMLPSQYRNQPANLLYALEFADSLGLHPMAAITGVHVIEGKPSASSALISALVRRAGHKLRVTGNDKQATAQIVRADDPEFTFECTWTWARAEQAGLTNKKVWKNYPAAMLKARAITEVAREACEEALSGMHYTPEELGANVNEDGLPEDASVQQLRRVQPGDGDPWATAPEPQAPRAVNGRSQEAQDFATTAADASDKAALQKVYREANAAGLLAETVKSPDRELLELGAFLIQRGNELAEPTLEPSAADDGYRTGPTADEVVDAEVVSPEDDYAAAVAELREAAELARLEDFDAGTEQALGMPLADAPVEAIRALAATIRPAA
ncbi:recombinase family protein [[Kitasatospora] papulosa]